MSVFSRMPKIVKFIVVAIILFGLLFTVYCGRILWIKKFGINIKPSEEIQPYTVEFFIQNDNRWKDFNLGNSNFNIGGYGCLLSVIASSCDYLGYETNPKSLNKVFTDGGVYTDSGDVIWYKINETIPNIKYKYKRNFSRNTIQSDLKNGFLPIVMVKYKKTGIYHWVLIVGSTNDDFLIVDPLNQEKELIPLKTHGNVYAYRVLIQEVNE